MLRILSSLCFLIGLLCTSSTYAANAVHQYQLKNGLTLLVKEDHRAPVVVSMVWYKVGSAYEHGGTTGISHALEHMMFQGTSKYPAGALGKIIADNGGSQNAMTTSDYTVYYQQLAASALPVSFELEADRMRNLTLAESNFAKEIKVVREERLMRTEDDPQSLTYERFMAALHLVSPYHHPVVGWMNDLLNMQVSNLRHWYQTWYAPNNAIVVVVGNVQSEQVYQLAEKFYGDIPSKILPVVKPQREPESRGERHVIVHAPAKLPFLMMGYNTPSLVTAKDKWKPYALTVLSGLLSGGDSSRIPRDIIRKTHIASSANVEYDLYSLYDSSFMLYGIPTAQHTVAQLQQAFEKQINDLQHNLVSAQELDRIKTQIIASKVYSKDSLSGQAMELGSLAVVGLPWQTGENTIKEIKAVTAEQVQQVAREYLITNNLTVAILKPEAIAENNKSTAASTNQSGDKNVQKN